MFLVQIQQYAFLSTEIRNFPENRRNSGNNVVILQKLYKTNYLLFTRLDAIQI